MAIEGRRKPNEPVTLFLRRFSEQVKRSRVLDEFKKGRFHSKKVGQRVKRKNALERKNYKERMEYLRKIGEIK